MVQVEDDFLDAKDFKELQDYCEENVFGLVKAGSKEFSVLEVPKNILKTLDNVYGHEISLCFIRRAYKDFDDEPRIHCDGIINGSKTSYARVLYINDNKGVTPNGTAFFNHSTHGVRLKDIDEDEFNRLILEDSNDESLWDMNLFVNSKPNRLLTYEASLFHSKYPNSIKEGERVVLVCFYKEKG